MSIEPRPTSRQQATRRQQRLREGVKTRLDEILAEQREQRQQLQALVQLLGVTLEPRPTEHRR